MLRVIYGTLVERSRTVSNAGHIRSLDGARGLAAVMVVLGHAQANAGSFPFFRGQPAVDVFFTLSGFVMSYIYLRGQPIVWKDFAVARFARIYPLHIATASAMAVLGIIYAELSQTDWPAHINGAQASREFTLTMAMPVLGAMKLWNFPAWSISVEWWTYFTLFPIIALCDRNIAPKLALTVFAVFAIPLAVWLYTDIKPTRFEPAFARALVGFCGGWVAYRFYQTAGPEIPGPAATTIAVAFLGCALASPFIFDDDAWFLIPLYPLLVYSLAACDSAASRFLSSRPLIWLGMVSYSIYLIHPIMLNLLEAIDAKIVPITGSLLWMGLALPLTLVASTVSYYFFEAPIRNNFRKSRKVGAKSKLSTAP